MNYSKMQCTYMIMIQQLPFAQIQIIRNFRISSSSNKEWIIQSNLLFLKYIQIFNPFPKRKIFAIEIYTRQINAQAAFLNLSQIEHDVEKMDKDSFENIHTIENNQISNSFNDTSIISPLMPVVQFQDKTSKRSCFRETQSEILRRWQDCHYGKEHCYCTLRIVLSGQYRNTHTDLIISVWLSELWIY
ncbi:unnamed protein product [Paramecium octaurelia]|uniref:Uncharacterized protein n=1 Tax=Paramecium octaurelia TaxID=43137 RepID=A0A8S1YQE5_PAROT|nr:unnamed protein product [Paramecium octaurelia]